MIPNLVPRAFVTLVLGNWKTKTSIIQTRQDDLCNSPQFYKTYKLNLPRLLNVAQLRNKRKKNVTMK